MKHSLKLLTDHELINNYQENPQFEIIEELLDRHSLLLKSITRQYTNKRNYASYDDCLQNAKIGLIGAVKRFDCSKPNKFVTFLYKTVYFYLITCSDNEAFIKCPSNQRKNRSLAAQNVNSEQYEQYKILFNDSLRLLDDQDDNIESASCFEDVYLQTYLENLPVVEQKIANYLIEGYSVHQITDLLSSDHIKKSQINKTISKFKINFYV